MSIDEFRAAAPAALRPSRTTTERTLLRWGVRPLLAAMDVTAFAMAVLVAGPLVRLHLAVLALTIALYASAGLYRPRLSLSVLDDLPSLAGRPLAAAAVVTTAAVAYRDTIHDPRDVVLTTLVFALCVLIMRTLGYAVVRRCRRDGVVAHPTLVLGAGRVGGHIAQLLLDHPEYGLRPVGFLDSDPLLGEDERPIPLLGGNEALSRVIVEFGVHNVIVAFGSAPESAMVDVIRTCDRLDAEIFFVPRLFELASGTDTDQVWGLPLVRLRRAAFRSPSWRVKRVLDVAIASIALLMLLPVMVVCAIAVRLEGGPGIFFSQERVGLDGRPFKVWKFRSMRPRDENDSRTTWSIANDDRVGPVGRVLRKTSLDELPQLWNILRGDMSVVGPRPERPHFVNTFAESFPRYVHRHRVPAGLTGWAQVHGLRGDTSIEDRARFDNFYIENWSLWTDVKIVVRTVGQVVRGSGA